MTTLVVNYDYDRQREEEQIAAVSLSSGKAVHYLCDESADWFPDLDDIRAKITHSRQSRA